MIGNRVRVYRLHGEGTFDGVLVKTDNVGVIVHKREGFDDIRLFIPFANISHIQDLGRAP